jgi:signal transduction histidine kinase
MHPLVRRQLRKTFPDGVPDDGPVAALAELVSSAYETSDADARQLTHALHLASDELYARNRQLESELEERKRLQVELQHAEKLRAVGQLAAGVAHEINTPVQFIGDSVSFLLDAFGELDERVIARAEDPDGSIGELCAEIPRALDRCRNGTERVATIVRALKTLAHPDGREQQLADLGDAIENTLIVAASELKFVADTRLELGSARKVRCHVGEIQQVLLNLLVNAGHAIAERRAGTEERGLIRIATRDDGPDVVLTISDDGAGIPVAARQHIFEPFFTTKPVGMGTGQGLSIVHALIVESHGGEVSFETELGVGTTFIVRLPANGRVDQAPLAVAS